MELYIYRLFLRVSLGYAIFLHTLRLDNTNTHTCVKQDEGKDVSSPCLQMIILLGFLSNMFFKNIKK